MAGDTLFMKASVLPYLNATGLSRWVNIYRTVPIIDRVAMVINAPGVVYRPYHETFDT